MKALFMFRPVRILAGICGLILLAACNQNEGASSSDASADPASASTVVAVVNGRNLTQADVQAYYEGLPPEYQQMPLTFVQEQLVERLIDRALIVDASRKAGLETDERHLRQLATTRDELLNDLWLYDQMEAALTDERLKAAYDEVVAGFTSAPEVQARHILFETEEEAVAVIKELNEGGIFNDIAREKSIGPSAPSGGDLGYFSEDQMVKPFSDAAFSLEVGTYTKEAVKSQFGWHVILVEDSRESSPPSYDDMLQKIRQAEAGKVFRKLLDDLRASATIEKITPADDVIEEEELPVLEGDSEISDPASADGLEQSVE
ncbi:MAG: peptidylprolyl isomerase [Proteobacteria bacterium]|nr:peptidylprolyl isomerase [Pseudomonadota bacterium]